MPGTIFAMQFNRCACACFLIIALCVLSSCGISKKIVKRNSSVLHVSEDISSDDVVAAAKSKKIIQDCCDCSDNDLYQAISIETRLTDIPVPLGTCPLTNYFQKEVEADENGLVLGYVCQLNLESLLRFYRREMSYLGWQCISEVDGNEALLLFEKPNRICSVSLRPFQASKNCEYMQLVLSVGEKSIPESTLMA